MASVSVMPCSVVLRRLSADMSTDATSGNALYALSTSALNDKGLGSETSAFTSFSQERCAPTSTSAEEPLACSKFKEPWTKVLLSAKFMSRRKRAQNLGRSTSQISPLVTHEKQKAPPSKSSTSTSLSIAVSKSKKNDIKQRNQKSKDENTSELSENPGSLLTTSSLPRPSQGRRKRASSVEWDWSGSESNDTPKVPLNKKAKLSMRRKRTPSVDCEWRSSGSESDNCSASNSNKQEHSNHVCYLCDKKFARPWRLRVHLQQHIDPKNRPFVCDEEGCSKSYFKKQHLDRHKSTSHSNLVFVSNVMCEGCKKIFSTASGLKRHMNKVHLTENLKFQCPTCDKRFSKTKQLRFHLAEHEGQPPLRCEVCNAGAYSDAALRRHARTHKTYECQVSGCAQTFSNYNSFRKHVAEHNKCFQSLKCAHCGIVCSNAQNLRSHVETHLDNKEVFRCPYDLCTRFYYQKRNLESHIRVKHDKTSKFKCDKPDCDKIFMSRRALLKHLNVHENGKAPMKKRKEGPRATRKDAGKPRRAMACKLTGIMLPREQEKELLITEQSSYSSKDEVNDRSAAQTVTDFSSGASIVDTPDCTSCSSVEAVNEIEQILDSNREDHSIDHISVATQPDSRKSKMSSEESIVSASQMTHISGSVPPDKSIFSADTSLHDTSLIISDSEDIISNLAGKIFHISEEGELVEVQENLQVDGVGCEATVNAPTLLLRDSTTTTESLVGSKCGSLKVSNNDVSQTQKVNSLISNSPIEKPNQDTRKTSLISAISSPCAMKGMSMSSDINTSANTLSATLCAQAILDVPLSCPESEVLLVVPKSGGTGVHEVNTEAVIKALSGDAEVFSVAEGNITTTSIARLLQNESNQSSYKAIKRISFSDPSVSSILQPLIRSLGNDDSIDNSAKSFCIIPLDLEDKDNIDGSLANKNKSADGLFPRSQLGNEASITDYSGSLIISEKEDMTSIQGERNKADNIACGEVETNPAEGLRTSYNLESRIGMKGKSSSSPGNSCLKQKIFRNPAHVIRKEGEKKISASVVGEGACNLGKGGKSSSSDEKCHRQMFHNPVYIEKGIKSLAELFLSGRCSLRSVKHKSNREYLQGPSEDSVDSGSSSSSDSESNSHSEDSSTEDTDPDFNANNSADDSGSDSDGNGDDEEEEEEEEDADEQSDNEENDEEEEEDDDDDDGNADNGPNEIIEGNNDNNNGDDNVDRSNSQESDRFIDHEPEGDRNVDHSSDFGIDRSLKRKDNEEYYNSDGGNSSRSDNLVIVTDETEREGKDLSNESSCNVSTLSRMSQAEGASKSLSQPNLSMCKKPQAKHDLSSPCPQSKLRKKKKSRKGNSRKLHVKSQWTTSESSDNEPLSKWLTKHKDISNSNSREKIVKRNGSREFKNANEKCHQKRNTLLEGDQKEENSHDTSDSQWSSDFEPRKKKMKPLGLFPNSIVTKQKQRNRGSHDEDEYCISNQEHARKQVFNFSVSDDSDNPNDPSWKPIKEEEDTDYSSEPLHQPRKELAKPEPVSFPPKNIKMPKLSSTEDPFNIPVKEEVSFEDEEFKKPLRSGLACSQLSESAWISVLREVSKTLKLSPSVVE